MDSFKSLVLLMLLEDDSIYKTPTQKSSSGIELLCGDGIPLLRTYWCQFSTSFGGGQSAALKINLHEECKWLVVLHQAPILSVFKTRSFFFFILPPKWKDG